MATDSLAYVLGTLRRLKATPNVGSGNPTIAFVREWVGSDSPLETGRLILAIQEKISDATSIITESKLSDEAKAGLLQTLGTLKVQFSFEALQNSVNTYFPVIDPAITNFAIISSSIGVGLPEEASKEINDFVSELRGMVGRISEFNLDENLASIVKRHIQLLIAMLINADAVGLNSAMSAYYDMILALRGEKNANLADDKEADGFWSIVKKWHARLELVFGLVDKGQQALPYINELPRLTGF